MANNVIKLDMKVEHSFFEYSRMGVGVILFNGHSNLNYFNQLFIHTSSHSFVVLYVTDIYRMNSNS